MSTKQIKVCDELSHHAIQIIDIPEGEAPQEIRKAWRGLVLPAYPFVGYGSSRERGAVTLGENNRNNYSYTVPQDKALEVLARSNPEAVLWWKENGYPKKGEKENCFSFPCSIAREVCGKFEYQKIIHITEEMQGDPCR